MLFKAKIYKLGKSGRLAIMVPKEVIVIPGEYDVEIKEGQVMGNIEPIEPNQGVVNPLVNA